MGLPRKIALTGGLLIGSIVLVAFLAKKTNILSGFVQGLTNTGSAIGTGIGQGLQNIGTGFIGGITGIGQQAAGSNWLSNMAGLQDILKGINPFADPRVQQAYGDVPSSGTSGYVTPDNQTIGPQTRDTSDLIGKTFNISSPISGSAWGKIPSQIASITPVTVQMGLKSIPTVDIRTSSGYYSQSLESRLKGAQEAVKNYKPTQSQAVTGGNRPAQTVSNKSGKATTTYKVGNKTYTLTKAKGKR